MNRLSSPFLQASRRSKPPKIVVLLALYDGADHLGQQLESIVAQDLPPSLICASDDCPGDGTGAIFEKFSEVHGRDSRGPQWRLIPGPSKGLTANFLHLLAQTDGETTDYVALSDQDDFWLRNKLSSAVAHLAPYEDRPALLGTRSWEWDAEAKTRKLSRAIPEPWDFTHALVQNFAGGNTMVLNQAALKLVQRALPGLPRPAMYDWWLYQLLSGAGGTVLLDSEPRLLYRQHRSNQVGANSGLRAKRSRLISLINGQYRSWMDQQLAALSARAHLLSPQSRSLLEAFQAARNGSMKDRLGILKATQIHRKGRPNQVALWIAAALRKM